MENIIIDAVRKAQENSWINQSIVGSPFHELVSCVISQRVSFTKSRQFREKLYTLLGSTNITPSKFHSIFNENAFAK